MRASSIASETPTDASVLVASMAKEGRAGLNKTSIAGSH